MKKIVIVGMGYVGSVTAYAFAKLGCSVVCVEKDKSKTELIRKGEPHFFEPGLAELIESAICNIEIKEDLNDVDFGSVHFTFICVGTPSKADGGLNLSAVYETVETLVDNDSFKSNPSSTIVVRSTIEGRTMANLQECLEKGGLSNEVLFHPEFLREGSAIEDFFDPPFIVCTETSNHEVKKEFEELYKDIKEVSFASSADLELLKLACNTWHALKVTFGNEVGKIAERVGADGESVMDIFTRDNKLNISKAYLRPGFAFGGACLPKDTGSLSGIAKGIGLKLIPAINPANNQLISMFTKSIVSSDVAEINWIGITFKEKTDDIRDSPYLRALLEVLASSDIKVNLYDPHLNGHALGRNRELNMQLREQPNLEIFKDLEKMPNDIITYHAHNYRVLDLEGKFTNLRKIS